MRDHRDLVIEMLADSEAAQRASVERLVEIVADLAFKNFVLQRVVEKHIVRRIMAEDALERERLRHRKAVAA